VGLNPYPANVEYRVSYYFASKWQMGFNSALKGLKAFPHLISHGIQINSREEAHEATSERTAVVASTSRGVTCYQWFWFETDQRYVRRIDTQYYVRKN
jgi:hypothetical protein